ncbi:MAG: N-carbamoyl-D-amino-acid hydrolase [Alphaproteobacteria bacterium]|nr:N-carbamoyl-D-amino-acid hydrolase [Alphaproteobacteria bacterium]
MTRVLTVAGAQLGPIARDEPRSQAVGRMVALMEKAHAKGAGFVVFPELALTTFFPRWFITDQAEVDRFFEAIMPNPEVQPLFDAARRLGLGFYLGYAERVREAGRVRHFNTAILVDASGAIVGRYRKVHLPGHAEFDPKRPWQHLEKRYFEPGDLGFPVFRAMGGILGMCICNDRRWPETFRVMGLQGVELVALGYNTPVRNAVARESEHLRMMHNQMSMQAGAYQNGTWVVGVAKAGAEEGVDMMAGSCIVAPTGEIVAQAMTEGDELIVYDCDLDAGRYIKETVFNFAAHRRIEHYGLITSQTGVVPPA